MLTSNKPIDQPIIIIGAGPIGLATAAHLAKRRKSFLILEASQHIAASLHDWRHVKLFSPWRFNIDHAAKALLMENGWVPPHDDIHPTAGDMIDLYLKPLAELPAISQALRLGHEVLSIARADFDKVRHGQRSGSPFSVRVRTNTGVEKELSATVVIDASGTWEQPNPLGANGLAAIGEDQLSAYIHYGIPDVLERSRKLFSGMRVAVVGSGHSAANSLIALAELAKQSPETEIKWLLRGSNMQRVFGGQLNDKLPARGQLGEDVRKLVESKQLEVLTDFRIHALTKTSTGILLEATDAAGSPVILEVDRIIAATGQRPQLSMLRELKLDVDWNLECVKSLAPMIDPNFHSCGTVPPHGIKELEQPESGFYIVGSKSYGRAPSFLLATGYEQVRSIVAYLDGDLRSAYQVELILPETGVCSSNEREESAICCAPKQNNILSDGVGCSDGSCNPSEQPQPRKVSSCC